MYACVMDLQGLFLSGLIAECGADSAHAMVVSSSSKLKRSIAGKIIAYTLTRQAMHTMIQAVMHGDSGIGRYIGLLMPEAD